MQRKVAYYTLGCKLNFSETSTIARDLEKEGFQRVEFTERLLEAPDAADPEQIPGTSGGAAPPG